MKPKGRQDRDAKTLKDAIGMLDALIATPGSLPIPMGEAKVRITRKNLAGMLSRFENTTLIHGNVEMRPRKRQVTVDGRELRLTPKEYDILYALMSEPDGRLSKEELADEVYGDATELDDLASLRSHIKNLRKKLDANDVQGMRLQTIHGYGYAIMSLDTI